MFFISPSGQISVGVSTSSQGVVVYTRKSIGEELREAHRLRMMNSQPKVKKQRKRRVLTEEEKAANKERYAKQKALKEAKKEARKEAYRLEQEKKKRTFAGRFGRFVEYIRKLL